MNTASPLSPVGPMSPVGAAMLPVPRAGDPNAVAQVRRQLLTAVGGTAPVMALSAVPALLITNMPAEPLGIALLAIALTIIPAIYLKGSFTYMVAGVLMLSALRGGPFGVGISGLAVGFAASWVVATGHAHALLTVVAPHDALVDTQQKRWRNAYADRPRRLQFEREVGPRTVTPSITSSVPRSSRGWHRLSDRRSECPRCLH